MVSLRPQHEVDPGGRPSPYHRHLSPAGQRPVALQISQRHTAAPPAQVIEQPTAIVPPPVAAPLPPPEPVLVDVPLPVTVPTSAPYFQVVESDPEPTPVASPKPLPTTPVYVEAIAPVTPLPPSGAQSFEFVTASKSAQAVVPVEPPQTLASSPEPAMPAVTVEPPEALTLPADMSLDEPAPIEPRIPIHHSWQRSRRPRFVLATIGLAVIVGAGIGVQGWLQTRQPSGQAQAASQSADVSSAAPSETPPSPSAVAQHSVASMAPRVVTIERLGVAARVISRDTADGRLQAPTTIYDAAWYDQSAKPGEAGAALLIAHASGPTKEGVFYGLKTLTAGDLIQIERGDRAILTFEVVSVDTVAADKIDMHQLLTSTSSDKPGLNLVTAAGNDAQRTVVSSVLRR